MTPLLLSSRSRDPHGSQLGTNYPSKSSVSIQSSPRSVSLEARPKSTARVRTTDVLSCLLHPFRHVYRCRSVFSFSPVVCHLNDNPTSKPDSLLLFLAPFLPPRCLSLSFPLTPLLLLFPSPSHPSNLPRNLGRLFPLFPLLRLTTTQGSRDGDLRSRKRAREGGHHGRAEEGDFGARNRDR